MTKYIGYKTEGASEGTNAFSTPATDVALRFGLEAYDRPHPQHAFPLTPSFGEGTSMARSLIKGMYELDFSIKTDLVHAGLYKHILGSVAHETGVSTFTMCAPGSLPSYSIYSEIDSDVISAIGCKAYEYNLDIAMGERVTQEIKYKGWKTQTQTALTNKPTWPTSLGDNGAWGWDQVSDKNIDDGDNLLNWREIHMKIQNRLDVHGGLGSQVPRGVEQLEGSVVTIGVTCTFDGTASDLLAALRAEDDTSVSFTLTKDSYSHVFTISDVMWHQPVLTAKVDRMPEYTVMGMAFAESATPISIAVTDGTDYSTAASV